MPINRYKILELMAKNKIKNFTELAKALGISKNQLSSILSNKYVPIKSNVIELANFLDIDPKELIDSQVNSKSKKYK